MKIFKIFLITIALIGFDIKCNAASLQTKCQHISSIQSDFTRWAKKNKIVGVSLLVDNQAYYYGYSNKLLQKPVSEKTQFGIGSITKTFISFILLRLEAEGKLNINDSVIKYLPKYPRLKNVTIKSLMQMTAGFNDERVKDSIDSPFQQIRAAYKNYDPKLAGTWQYSNASYQLLGLLIKKITRKPLSEVLYTNITLPLGLKSIHFPNKAESSSLKEYQNSEIKTTNFSRNDAAGGLVSNTHDLENFIRHLFVRKDLLPVKQYNELTTFINTPRSYYEFTGSKSPKFGLGVFKWDVSSYGEVLTYPGVLKEGFASTYIVRGKHVIILQTNTYNNNDFTLLWPHRGFAKKIIVKMNSKN